MAGVSIGGSKGKRAVDSEINMVPFIDLLLVTVAFLLITAVWTTNSRLEVNANLPGEIGDNPPAPEQALHVHVNDDSFTLTWMQGSVVVNESKVDRIASDPTHSRLRDAMAAEYRARGTHHDPDDHATDRVVLHTPNDMEYGDMVTVMDAVASTKRELNEDGKVAMVPAFNQTFAIR